MVEECPWGDERVNLVASELSAEEKLWLGSNIAEGTFTVTELIERFSLGRALLNKYAKRYRDGCPLYGGSGRPKFLDKNSIEAVKHFLTMPNGSNLNLLRDLIVSEFRQTLERSGKWVEGANGLLPRLSDRSLHRCMREFSAENI